MRRLSQNVPAKPPFGTMCLQDNLADCADSGGLHREQIPVTGEKGLALLNINVQIAISNANL